MNAAVSDFKVAGNTSKKISKNEFEDYLIDNIELVPDILKDICKSKKESQTFLGFCAFTAVSYTHLTLPTNREV